MITQIKVRNYALISELDLPVDKGMSVITGETGAGKSVITGALKLVLGERAEKSLIRTGESQCAVEAVFSLPDPTLVDRFLVEGGLEPCEDGLLIVKRVISAGTNRQFLNNSPVTLSLLKSVGENLVDLHGPHDHQGLLSTDRQLAMLDAYAGLSDQVAAYHSVYREWREKRDELEDLKNAERASAQEIDLLKFQVDEIEAAHLQPDEEEEIESRYKRASNSSRLLESSGEAVNLLNGEEGVLDKLAELQRIAHEIQRNDPETEEMLAGLDAAVVEIRELESALEDYVSDLEIDPAEEEELAQRINTFETLKRKYGTTLQDVIDHAEEAAKSLHAMENRGEVLEELEESVKVLRKKVDSSGAKISSKRKKAAPKLAKEIIAHLTDLGFKQSLFEVQLTKLEKPSASGLEAIEFMFGPNPGEPLKPLRGVASSGEISRVMLAVKSALADQDATPLMVFDEIDANVGGSIARAVGKKMAALGASYQVVAITHFPQVAAVAKEHFLVTKDVAKGRTLSRLEKVEGEARIEELVRMLGGGGEEVRKMAEGLLKG